MQKFQFLRERHDQKELDIFVVFTEEPQKLRMITLPQNYHKKLEERKQQEQQKKVPLIKWNQNKPKPRI